MHLSVDSSHSSGDASWPFLASWMEVSYYCPQSWCTLSLSLSPIYQSIQPPTSTHNQWLRAPIMIVKCGDFTVVCEWDGDHREVLSDKKKKKIVLLLKRGCKTDWNKGWQKKPHWGFFLPPCLTMDSLVSKLWFYCGLVQAVLVISAHVCEHTIFPCV